jgi:hypothetical protein
MKYILLMTGTKAGVDTYRAWSKTDVQAHFDFLRDINKELSESGEFVATEPLAGPGQGCAGRQGWRADHGRGVPGGKRVSSGLLDR